MAQAPKYNKYGSRNPSGYSSAFGRRAATKATNKAGRGAIKALVGLALQGTGYVTAGVGAATGNPGVVGLGLLTLGPGVHLTKRGMEQFDAGQRAKAKATAIDDLIQRAKKRKSTKAKAASDGIVKAHYRTNGNGVTTFVKAHMRKA